MASTVSYRQIRDSIAESYQTLYRSIPDSFESFPKNTIPQKLSSIHDALDILIAKIEALSIQQRIKFFCDCLPKPLMNVQSETNAFPEDFANGFNLEEDLSFYAKAFLSKDPSATLSQELQSRVISYLDLHATLLEDFNRVLELHPQEEVVSHVREGIIFATSPLELALTTYKKDKNPDIRSPIKTHLFFHTYACSRRVQYFNRLGQGSYGYVHLAILGKMSLACKQSKLPDFSKGFKVPQPPSTPDPFSQPIKDVISKTKDSHLSSKLEACALQQLRHRHIISLLAIRCTPITGPILYLELAEKTLYKFILEQPKLSDSNFCAISHERRLEIFTQITLALNYLHKKGFIHKDLSLTNVLLDKNGNIKICDFGFVTFYNEEQNKTLCGEYAPPESICQISSACDIWAVGVMLFFSFKADFPYKKQNMNGITESNDDFRFRMYELTLYSTSSSTISSLFKEAKWDEHDKGRFWRRLMKGCLKIKPEERCSAENILLYLGKST